VTIKDIARLAGVSPSTVSRSLNNSGLISQETRARIWEIARSVGFEFNSSARGLITRRTGTIGIILPDDFDQLHIQVYHSALHNHLRRSLEQSELDLLVSFSSNRFTGSDSVVKLVQRTKVDGLIVVLPSLPAATESFLDDHDVPYLYAHYPPQGANHNVERVYPDHEAGGVLVGELFAGLRFSRILAFRSADHELEFDQRINGLKKAFADAGHRVALTEMEGLATYESGYRLVEEHLAALGDVDAVFAINDLMAIGMLHAMQAGGIRVPEDVSLVGYDGSPLAATLRPRITTIQQPAERVGHVTCERLVRMIEDRASGREHVSKTIALKPSLVVGETTPPGGEA
jgi:LacI family transcriptional regulator